MVEQILRPGNWSTIADHAAALAAVPGMTISRALQLIAGQGNHYFDGKKNDINRIFAEGLKWPRLPNGTPMFRVAPVNGISAVVATCSNNELIVPDVIERIDGDTDAVVDLGCGYGRLIFTIRDLVEHLYPKLKYFAGELSEDGLKATRIIAGMEPNRTPVGIHAYNHLDPSFDFLAGCKKVVFFTCHTIEQVTLMTETLFLRMLESVERLVCIHAEPVGWQMNAEVMGKIEDGSLGKEQFRINPYTPVNDGYAAHTPVVSGWNRNLISVLQGLEKKGRIKIESIDLNYCGNEIYNPSTRIVWVPA